MVQVRQDLIAAHKYKLKCPNSMDPDCITIHNTSNDASAVNEMNYMKNSTSSTSFHYAIDDKEVLQGIPLNRNAWHAGDGAKGPGNRKSIGVEICYSKSGGSRYVKAEENTVQFVAKMLKERGWGIERVKKHQDWSGKYCPHRILDEGRWQSFLNRVVACMKDGWKVENGVWVYYKDGALLKNNWALDSKKKWFYLGENGVMVANKWVRWKNKWYYMGPTGEMATGRIKVGKEEFYLQPDGACIITDKRGVIIDG